MSWGSSTHDTPVTLHDSKSDSIAKLRTVDGPKTPLIQGRAYTIERSKCDETTVSRHGHDTVMTCHDTVGRDKTVS